MAGIILSSYVLIVLGILVLGVGFLARARGNPNERYLLGGGAVLVLLGLAGLVYFMQAFG